ncbi:MAG TPA: four-carbon acid sugar kinase family protein [Candidatus Binatia bacterium]|nr:four-carbon acid sugar kinase family protein [Candidatus Binatia bacterium]
MDALRVIADDLTGACDVGAELLPWPSGVAVQPAPGARAAAGVPAQALCVRNTQSRTLAPARAAERVASALADVSPRWAGIVLKKIDTGLRGQLGAELDAAMDALGSDEAFVLPAIPEVGRTTEAGRQMIGGVPVDQTAFARDPQNPIADASVPAAVERTSRRRAAVIGLDAVREPRALAAAVDRARAGGAQVLVCDAQTDADLERAVRGLLARGRPLLLAGSAGLARALRRVLGPEQGSRPAPPALARGADGGVLAVVGSAHPTSRGQVERAAGRGLLHAIPVDGARAEAAGIAAGAALRTGRAVALVAPVERVPDRSEEIARALRAAALAALARARPIGLALVGGETAYQVLDGLGHPPLWLVSRLCPLVVRARLLAGAYAGLALVTKGGSTGAPDLLGHIVRQLGRSGR